ncbi:MAG: BMC domain-containing protein [Andreesenia angusta]|nr:BMC domain-containing protein [Andreesenia angusta]
MRAALGIIESIGLTTAMTALDAACKAADVNLIGFDKVIGVDKAVSVVIHIGGEVAAVRAAVDAGSEAGERVGHVAASHVIPRPHEEIDKLMKAFEENLKAKKSDKETQAKAKSLKEEASEKKDSKKDESKKDTKKK